MKRLFALFLLAVALGVHGQTVKFASLGYGAPVPKQWQAVPPANNFRLAQYRVPGAGGDAESIVFYFGKGQGGTVAANIQRWTSQFTTTDGKPVQPKTQVATVGELPMTTVELNGSYARGVGSGPQGDSRPNQTLLVAILETPQGNVTFQLHGPRETVAAHRKGFESMVRGFRKS